MRSSPSSYCSPVHTEEVTQEEVVEEEGQEVSLSRLEEEIQVRSEAAPHIVRVCVTYVCMCSCRRRVERVRRKKKEPSFWTSPDCSRPQNTRLAPDHHHLPTILYYTTIVALPPDPCPLLLHSTILSAHHTLL